MFPSKSPRPAGPNLWQTIRVAQGFRRGSVKELEVLCETYGELSYLPFPIDAYLVNSPALVEKVLRIDHQDFRKSNNYREMKYLMGNGLVTSEGELWRRQRKSVNKAFHLKAIEGYCADIEKLADTLVDDWATSEWDDIDVSPALTLLTTQIASQVFLGADSKEVAQEVHRCATVAGDAFLKRVYSPITLPRWVPTKTHRVEREAVETLNRIVYELIDRGTAQGEKSHVLSMLLSVVDEETGGGMSRRQLRDELITIFLAGHDTINAALTWFFYLVAGHPDVQEKIRVEIVEVAQDKMLKPSQYRELSYTEAAFNEALRIYPVIPVLARTPTRDVLLGDYVVAANSIVLCPIYGLHRSPRYWDCPEEYRPERFLMQENGYDYRFIPFAGGPRKCIGDRLAMTEAMIIISKVLGVCRLERVSGFLPKPHTTVTMMSENGMRLRVRAL